jgi:hypothetical protein
MEHYGIADQAVISISRSTSRYDPDAIPAKALNRLRDSLLAYIAAQIPYRCLSRVAHLAHNLSIACLQPAEADIGAL